MSTEARVGYLEQVMAELAAAQARTSANLDRLSDEMRAFKGEMTGFKGEMAAFKDEMAAFKDGIRADTAVMKAEIAGVSKQMGRLSNKMGTMAEDIVAPGIPALFARLFHVDNPGWRVRDDRRHPEDPARSMELDVTAWGGGVFLANETKSAAKPDDVARLLDKIAGVRDFFPEAKGLSVVGSLASFHVDSSLVRAAEREGLLVFGLGTGLMEVLNTPGFEPRRF